MEATSWIYSKLFGDSKHTKAKQDASEKIDSSNAFKQVKEIFEPEPSSSMSNSEIPSNTKKKFKK
ncbi:MAG: hypothetical protein KDK36_00820 [Leptospiraceae bacterium]|nr:hypothetical protein [Leptospiraceae bacterium]